MTCYIASIPADLRVPPLRERPEDIHGLVEHILQIFAFRNDRQNTDQKAWRHWPRIVGPVMSANYAMSSSAWSS